MIKPYLKYKEEASGETWIENAFSKENVEEIMQGVEGVVNDPEGTGYAAHRDDILLFSSSFHRYSFLLIFLFLKSYTRNI